MNKFAIRDPRRNDWPCHNSQLMTLVANAVLAQDGVKINFPSGSKWPQEGILPVTVQGVKVWVNPIPAVKASRKSSKHRAMCECPGCGKEMSVGRLHQHICKKDSCSHFHCVRTEQSAPYFVCQDCRSLLSESEVRPPMDADDIPDSVTALGDA